MQSGWKAVKDELAKLPAKSKIVGTGPDSASKMKDALDVVKKYDAKMSELIGKKFKSLADAYLVDVPSRIQCLLLPVLHCGILLLSVTCYC